MQMESTGEVDWSFCMGSPPELTPFNQTCYDFYLRANSQFTRDFHGMTMLYDIWPFGEVTFEKARRIYDNLIEIHYYLKPRKNNG